MRARRTAEPHGCSARDESSQSKSRLSLRSRPARRSCSAAVRAPSSSASASTSRVMAASTRVETARRSSRRGCRGRRSGRSRRSRVRARRAGRCGSSSCRSRPASAAAAASGMSWYGVPGAAERREHVELPRLQLGARERAAAAPGRGASRAARRARAPAAARSRGRGARAPRRRRSGRPRRWASRHYPATGRGRRRRRMPRARRAHAGRSWATARSGRLDARTGSIPRDPPWCNGSTTAFGAVRSRFESWRRSDTRSSADAPRGVRAMTDQNLAIIVLAAGQGTRMKSATPKLLHPIAGVPLVGHVLATARALDAAHVVAVVRHERDLVVAVIERRAAREHHRRPGRDARHRPRRRAGARGAARRLRRRRARRERRRAAARRRHPRRASSRQHRGGCRRGIRALRHPRRRDRLRPHRARRRRRTSTASSSRRTPPTTSSPSPRSTPASTSSASPRCATSSRTSTTDNAQGEKYLTDVIGLLRAAGSEVEAVPVAEPWIVAGINDRVQLAETAAAAERAHRARLAARRRHRSDPATTWIDLTCAARADVEILPGTQIKGATVVETGAIDRPGHHARRLRDRRERRRSSAPTPRSR